MHIMYDTLGNIPTVLRGAFALNINAAVFRNNAAVNKSASLDKTVNIKKAPRTAAAAVIFSVVSRLLQSVY